MPMFDFKCSSGHVTEEIVKSDVEKLPCPTCGLEASRQLGMPRIRLDGTSGDFPGAYYSWEKKREKQIKWERSRSYAKPPQ